MDMNLAFNESDSDNDQENPSDAGMDYRLVPMVAVNSILNLAVVINAIVCFIKHVRCLHFNDENFSMTSTGDGMGLMTSTNNAIGPMTSTTQEKGPVTSTNEEIGMASKRDQMTYYMYTLVRPLKFEDRKKWVHWFGKPFRKFSILVETHRDIDCITEENHELLDIDYITEEHHELLYIKQMNISRIIGTTVVVYAVYILYLPRMLCKQCRLQVTPETALPLFICITQLQDIERDISVTSLLIS